MQPTNTVVGRAVRLALADEMGAFPSNLWGSGEVSSRGTIFANDAEAIESVTVHADGDRLVVCRVYRVTTELTSPATEIDAAELRELAPAQAPHGERVAIPWSRLAPRAVMRTVERADRVFERVAAGTGRSASELRQALADALAAAATHVEGDVVVEQLWPHQVKRVVRFLALDRARQMSRKDAKRLGALPGDEILEPVESSPELANGLAAEVFAGGVARGVNLLLSVDCNDLHTLRQGVPEQRTLSEVFEAAGIQGAPLRRLFADRDDVLAFGWPRADSWSAWQALAAAAPRTGHWPVILGDLDLLTDVGESWDHFRGMLSAESYPGAEPLRSHRFDVKSPEQVLEMAERLGATRFLSPLPAPAPSSDVPDRLETAERSSRRMVAVPGPARPIQLALVRTRHQWEVPAYLPLVRGEDTPSPVELVAMLRHWHERFGARLAVHRPDTTLELHIARPPQRAEEAQALRAELCGFCRDTPQPDLRGRRYWRFWFD